MILTVTLNAALDVTYPVASLVPDSAHQIERAHVRAGGKGVNVARVLEHFGQPVLATGLVGGTSGAAIRHDLDGAGIRHHFCGIAGESRRTVTVVAADTGDATAFNERGPLVSIAEWRDFLEHFDHLVRDASVVVCSGSLPPGLPVDAYAELCRRARTHGIPSIVDTAGPALVAAAEAAPATVKPNSVELRATTRAPDLRAGAGQLLAHGAEAVVVSLGPDGLLAVTHDNAWQARPPGRISGNPTGAGDACVAALASGLLTGSEWPDRLRTAVAWSAAAVPMPYAGDVDDETYRRMFDRVQLEEIHAFHSDR
jgi:tagatose 6-phosphate kinase